MTHFRVYYVVDVFRCFVYSRYVYQYITIVPVTWSKWVIKPT